MHKIALSLSVALLGISACTNGANPQVAMCQAVAKQLTGNTVSNWEGDSKTDGLRTHEIKVDFKNASGQVGSVKCSYKKHEDGKIETAPTTVAMNNQRINQKVLFEASALASKEVLTGAYKNTVAKSSELADQAGKKATELASQAQSAAIKGAQTLQQLQDTYGQ